jgi:hypothetical protein
MKIDRASEFIAYNHLFRSSTEQGPRFIRTSESDKENKGNDAVEITEIALTKFLEKDALKKRLQSLPISSEVLSYAMHLIKNYDHDNAHNTDDARIDELKTHVSSGAYDFNERYKLSILADIALSYRP